MSTGRIVFWSAVVIGSCTGVGLLAQAGLGGLVLFVPVLFVVPGMIRSWVQERRLERMYRRG